MIRPSRVGFVVDHPTRDLPGGLLLADALARRGVETVLIPQYEQGVDVPLLALDAVVLNYARPVNLELAQSFAAAGTAVFVLDTEGGVLSEDGHSTPARLAAYIRESGYAEVLAGYFFWGSALHAAFVDGSGMEPSRLHPTGCPRFDFYSPDLRDLNPPKRTGHILVNTNYPLVNPRFVKAAGGDRAAIREVGYDDAFIDTLFAATAKVKDGVIATVRRLAADLPAQQFILRPHPFENSETYDIEFRGMPNVTVDGAGPVFDAIHGAKALLHLNCGTAIEALMLGVPPLAMEFLNVDALRAHASLPSRASLGIHAYEDLLVRLKSSDPGAGWDLDATYDAVARPYFHTNDGLASERVADVLADCCARAQGSPRPSLGLSLAASRSRPRIGQRLQSLSANIFGSALSGALRARWQPIRKGKEFFAADIDQTLAQLAAFRGGPAPRATRARHPLSGVPLASVLVTPERLSRATAA